MKKFLSILLSVILMVSICPLGVFEFTASAATSGTCGDNVTWEYDTSTYTLSISGTGAIGNYSSTYNSSAGYVTTAPWVAYRSEMKTLIINTGVTSIGNNAFCGCIGFTSVTIPNSVKSIGYNAFLNCSGLNKTNFTGSVGEWCSIHFEMNVSTPTFYSHNFYINDVLVTDLVIPNTITTISAHAFEFCQCFTSVTIPNTITSIETSAFYGCSSITSLRIPGSVNSIGLQAFDACSALNSITLGNSPLSIGERSLDNCTALAHVWYQGSEDEKNNNLTVNSLGNDALKNARWHYYAEGTQEFVTGFAAGIGTKDDPFLISTVEHLYNVRDYLSSHFTMTNDIDLTEATAENGDWSYGSRGWNPIGSGDIYDCTAFSGTFDGNGYSIIGIRMHINAWVSSALWPSGTKKAYVGLFANVTGTVKNLSMKNVYISGVYDHYDIHVGAIAGMASGNIENCKVEAKSIYGYSSGYNSYVGGLVGYSLNGTINKCYVNANDHICAYCQNSSAYVGGICGYGGGIINSYNNASVDSGCTLNENNARSKCHAAGIANSAVLENCYNTGTVHILSGTNENIFIVSDNVFAYAIGENSATGCYYLLGTGNGNAGSTELTEELATLQYTYTTFDFNDTWTMYGDPNYLYPELQCFDPCREPFGHDYVLEVIEPTCVEVGYTTYTCLRCGYNYVDDYVGALGHTGGAATCHSKAICTRCGNEYGEFDLDNHDGETEIRDAKTPTCTEAGYTGDTYCLACGAIVLTGEIISAISHAWGEWVTLAPATCTTKGIKMRICANNPAHTENSYIEELGHDYKAIITNPTCTTQGYTTHTCSRCDNSYVDTYVDALGHTLAEWECGDSTHWHICTTCGEKLDEAEHTASDWIIDREASMQVTGEKHKECTVCGKTLETGIIPKLYTPGDINGDESVNNKDLTRLFQYLSDWDVEVNEAALDINGDGSVNNKDLTRLFQYLSDWDVEIY